MMHHPRSGFSLMEVMLSTAILLGSSIALVELATIGRRQASSAYDLNSAQLLCEAKLNEIVAGISSTKAVEEKELEDNPGWMYSVTVEPLRARKLLAVKVTVIQEEKGSNRPVQFSLVRWLPDRPADSSPEVPEPVAGDTPNPTGATKRNSRREATP